MTQNLKKPKKQISLVIAVVGLIAALVIGSVGGYFLAPKASASTNGAHGLSGVINIGAALPLTGDLAAYGATGKAALTLAESQINAALSAANAGYSINLLFEDTQTEPDVALTATQDLAAKGVQVIIGYYSTSELSNCLNYAQTNHIVLISPASTGLNLAIDKPYIFRFVPADDKQGPAAAAALYSLGITDIVPIARDDAYGNGLVNSTENAFKALGGSYDTNGISYSTSATDFSSYVALLNTQVENAISTYGASHVAVYAVTFDELESIITSATQYPALAQVRWFGSDGNTPSGGVSGDATTAAFATSVDFEGTDFSPSTSATQTQVANYVQSQTGYSADPYSFGIYDALWVVAKTLAFTQQNSGTAINSALPTIADQSFGASGLTELNSYGDRATGDYEIYQIYQVNATAYNWEPAGLYTAATQSVTWNK